MRRQLHQVQVLQDCTETKKNTMVLEEMHAMVKNFVCETWFGEEEREETSGANYFVPDVTQSGARRRNRAVAYLLRTGKIEHSLGKAFFQ